jgi:hypothetical protein
MAFTKKSEFELTPAQKRLLKKIIQADIEFKNNERSMDGFELWGRNITVAGKLQSLGLIDLYPNETNTRLIAHPCIISEEVKFWILK